MVKRKAEANRRNARASTGPKTRIGRKHSSRNALLHGLSLPVASDPVLSEGVDQLASEIAGKYATPEIQELAHRIAEAHVDLCRVRQARLDLLARDWTNPYYDIPVNVKAKVELMMRALRPKPIDLPLQALINYILTTPEGPEKHAFILTDRSRKLMTMDRYERRALSRRNKAIRALDEALLRLR